MTNDSLRAWGGVSETPAIGLPYVLEASAVGAAVRCCGIALKVYDAIGDCRGTFPNWGAAHASVLGLAAEWEARVNLSGG